MRYFLLLVSALLLSSCNNKKEADVEKARPSGKPQVTDALRGKTNVQILARKYQVTQTQCSLVGKKFKKNQLVLESLSEFTLPETAFLAQEDAPDNSVVIDPAKPFAMTFDLKEKVKTDKDLSKPVDVALVATLEDYNLKLKMNIKPISFGDLYRTLVNAETGKQTLYLMKYSPVQDYGYSYELHKPGAVRIIGDNDNKKIFEKVLTATSVYKEVVGDEIYEFSLNCMINTSVNENDPLKEEFRSQWCEAQVPAKPIELQSVQSVINPIARCKQEN